MIEGVQNDPHNIRGLSALCLRAARRLIEVVSALKRVLETVQGFLNALFGCVSTPEGHALGHALSKNACVFNECLHVNAAWGSL